MSPYEGTDWTDSRFYRAVSSRAGTAAVMVAAVGVTIFAAFQPWFLRRASDVCVTEGQGGLESGGAVTLVFAALVLILAADGLRGTYPRLMLKLVVTGFIVIGVIAGFMWLMNIVFDDFLGCPAKGVGSGIYLTWLGSTLGIATCCIALQQRAWERDVNR